MAPRISAAAATVAAIATAVRSYLQANPAPKGDKGDPGPSAVITLGTVAIAQSAAIAIAAGIRSITLNSVTGVKAGEPVTLVPVGAIPAGYAIHNAVAIADGTLQVTLSAPLLAIGANYSIPCRVVALR